MRRTPNATGRRYQRGAIAVEAAIVFPLLLLFFGLPSILYAFYFRQYTALQKASRDASTYLSTASRLEMTLAGPDNKFAALSVAQKIVIRELTGIVPDVTSIDFTFTCSYRVSGSAPKGSACTPQTFKFDTYKLVRIDVTVGVPYINPMTGLPVDNMYMQTVTPARYLGN